MKIMSTITNVFSSEPSEAVLRAYDQHKRDFSGLCAGLRMGTVLSDVPTLEEADSLVRSPMHGDLLKMVVSLTDQHNEQLRNNQLRFDNSSWLKKRLGLVDRPSSREFDVISEKAILDACFTTGSPHQQSTLRSALVDLSFAGLVAVRRDKSEIKYQPTSAARVAIERLRLARND